MAIGKTLRPGQARSAAPNRLRGADITYVCKFAGWVHAAFVMDVFSRRIVRW